MAREAKSGVMEKAAKSMPAKGPDPAPETRSKALRGRETLPFDVGDNVEVDVRVVEGDKERIQVFSGVVIQIQGRGNTRAFAVRRLVEGEGVERLFPVRSPRISRIRVVRRGKVRRAKLYYLREKMGRETRLKEGARDFVERGSSPSAPTADAAPEAENKGV
jgi:large subunit ribosomal protein L19